MGVAEQSRQRRPCIRPVPLVVDDVAAGAPALGEPPPTAASPWARAGPTAHITITATGAIHHTRPCSVCRCQDCMPLQIGPERLPAEAGTLARAYAAHRITCCATPVVIWFSSETADGARVAGGNLRGAQVHTAKRRSEQTRAQDHVRRRRVPNFMKVGPIMHALHTTGGCSQRSCTPEAST